MQLFGKFVTTSHSGEKLSSKAATKSVTKKKCFGNFIQTNKF